MDISLNFKKICSIFLLTSFLTVQAYAYDWPVSANNFNQKTAVLSIEPSITYEFSADDLESRFDLSFGELLGATISKLPNPSVATLYLDGVQVTAYDSFTREELDRLCITPNTGEKVEITFIPLANDATPTNLSIEVNKELNQAPIIKDSVYTTEQEMWLYGYVRVQDKENDFVNLQISVAPQKGSITFDGCSFIYKPFTGTTGKDKVQVKAVDAKGNYSKPATIYIDIEKRNRKPVKYIDMSRNQAEYSANKLHQAGIFSGDKVGNSLFFHPEKSVTKGELIVMILSSTGLDKQMRPCVNTGLQNDASIPLYLKPYIKVAIDEKIITEKTFYPNSIPTRAEAVILVDRASKISDVTKYNLNFNDLGSIPTFALKSYMNLGAYKMLDSYDGNIYPLKALDRAYVADLIWQLYKHSNES